MLPSLKYLLSFGGDGQPALSEAEVFNFLFSILINHIYTKVPQKRDPEP